jgi:asparagine synthase (glutamine-hydrolysing)
VCGIAGALGARDPGLVAAMLAAIEHRGPDGRGSWTDGHRQLGVARLAIVDLGATAAPLTNETGTIRLAFNGEIYNHRELRAGLERRGHVFATRTDSEVVVHLYEEEGIDCVNRLRGMFAFAVIDGEQLWLARDRLGIKPLYYAVVERSGLFVFASEIKALLRCDELEPTLDLQALADRVVLGHAVSTRTYVAGIQSLAAGHTMTVESDHVRLRVARPIAYFDRRQARDEDIGYDEAQQALDEALEDAIQRHLEADVEVGVALSGGLDSTMLAMIAHDQGRARLQTFTLADEERNPDIRMGAAVAAAIGADHHASIVAFDEYLAAIPGFIATEEQPSSLIGMPFYLLSRRVADTVKVCLCGEGADELFGGYRDYLDRGLKLAAVSRRLPVLERLGVALSDEATELIACLSSTQTFNEYLQAIFDVNLRDPLERLHLDGVDKSAMASGVEMRVPYLDDRVYSLVASLPLRFRVNADLGIRKYILRRLWLHRYGVELADVVLREKLGVPSSGVHLVMRFDSLCDEVLPDDYLDRHELGYCFPTKRQLLSFEMFQDIFRAGSGGSAIGNVLDYMQDRGEAAQASAARGAAMRAGT